MIGHLQVCSSAGVVRECSPPTPQLIFCADSYFSICSIPHVTPLAHQRPQSFYQKCRWQVSAKHSCTLGPTSWCVGWLCHPDMVQEPIRETSSHKTCQETLVHSRGLSSMSHWNLILGLREWNWCTQADITLKKEEKSADREWFTKLELVILTCKERATPHPRACVTQELTSTAHPKDWTHSPPPWDYRGVGRRLLSEPEFEPTTRSSIGWASGLACYWHRFYSTLHILLSVLLTHH